jgi:hypothetical protein
MLNFRCSIEHSTLHIEHSDGLALHAQDHRIGTSTRSMADNNALYAVRFPDGSVSLYIDEDYAIERGVDPATLTRVEIPRDLFVSGTVQEIREYVALYLESRHSGTA